MARRPTRRLHRDPLWREMDLVPVMNLFMVLIPFLLLSAVFVKTAVIDVHLPTESQGAVEPVTGDILTVHATDVGFSFSGLGAGLGPVRKKGGAFDFELLSERLLELKRRYPESREVIILFKADMPYELIIKTMDAAREIIKTKSGETVRLTLFPLVSVGEHLEKEPR